MSIRDLRARKTKALHAAFAVRVAYLVEGQPDPTYCDVRVHTNTKALGDMSGFDYQPSERLESVPEIIALTSEVIPSRGGVFSVALGEAYLVETVMPPEGDTVKCQCARLSAAKADGLALPEDEPVV